MSFPGANKALPVIIVGGGPVGLIAAHTLYAAGIDCIVLEGREAIVEDKGASLVLHAHTFRVLHQLGFLEDVLAAGSELHHHLSFTKEGHVFKEGSRYEDVRKNHGYGAVAMNRADLVRITYNSLPDQLKEKVLTRKRIKDIQMNKSNVLVVCTDNSTYSGSMVIGADGVHSTTRRIMRETALKQNPSRSWDPEDPFTANYQLLFGSFPSPSGPGLGYDVQSKDRAIMYLSGTERSWFFLYKKLSTPMRGRARYSEEDINNFAKEFWEYPLTRHVKVKDVWPQMLGAGLTNLDEGMVEHWSLGRIVLVGDACHKMTTHLGLGYNNGVQDVVVLSNILRRVFQYNGDEGPHESVLDNAFKSYESFRKSSASSLVADISNAGLETRMHAWKNWAYYLLSRWVFVPNFVENFAVNYVTSPQVQKGQVLDYVSVEEVMKGEVAWSHSIPVDIV